MTNTKRTNTFYWIFTGIFGAFMLLSAIPDVLMVPQAVEFMTHLGYPEYFIVFIGVAKILGSLAILIPGFPIVKEWAYAGLIFDLIGAIYSIFAIGEGAGSVPVFLPLIVGICSYIFYHKRRKERAAAIPS
ncbi:MAG: DoxX-like family protein [Bacteroidota bacterium]|jgi:hypothetical protein|nr:DoxX-like family protein [Bacteroidota bacterium]